jgi:hypothetical protein
MATTKAKRSVHPAQLRRRLPATISPKRTGKCFRFPQARGKLIKTVEFWTGLNDQSITINFQDKTCLHFSVQPGFTLRADYSDWHTGEQRVLHRWSQIRSY